MTLIAAAYALEKLAAGRAPKPMRLIDGETRIGEICAPAQPHGF